MSQCKGLAQGPFGRAALLEIDKPIVGHAHPHCHLLVKVAGADSHFRVRGHDYPLDDTNAVAVNSWEPHAYPTAPTVGAAVILALYIRTDWLEEVEPGFAVCASPDFFAKTGFALPATVRTRVQDVADALSAPSSHGRAFEALMSETMIAVIDRFSRWRELRRSRITGHWRIPDFRIRRAIGFLHDHIGHGFTAEDIARAAGLSRPHLYTLFKHHTGLTPNVYFSALRMESAFTDLPDPAPSVATIFSKLGFHAQGHFTRFFRNNLGISPREYRHLLLRQT
jgi:AraC-like DNA-binding protein